MSIMSEFDLDGSASGSGFFSDNESLKFSCKYSILSSTAITNTTAWQLRDMIADFRVLLATAEILILLIALLWNGFIIIAYMVKYRLLKEPANIFLLALAITDIGICILVLPPSIVTAVTNQFQLGSNEITRCRVCYAQAFFTIFLTLLTFHILAALSVDRMLILSKPLQYKKYKKPWIAVVILASFIMLSFLQTISPAFGFGQWEFNKQIGICIPRWTPLDNLYAVMVTMSGGVVSIIILATTNIYTYKMVAMVLRVNLARQRTYRTGKECKKMIEKHSKQQKQLVRVFGALILTSVIVWSPVMIMAVVTGITNGEGVPNYVYTIGWIAFITNPMIHPILESFFVKQLRTKLNNAQSTVRKSIRKASYSFIRATSRPSIRTGSHEAQLDCHDDDHETPPHIDLAAQQDNMSIHFQIHISPQEDTPSDTTRRPPPPLIARATEPNLFTNTTVTTPIKRTKSLNPMFPYHDTASVDSAIGSMDTPTMRDAPDIRDTPTSFGSMESQNTPPKTALPDDVIASDDATPTTD